MWQGRKKKTVHLVYIYAKWVLECGKVATFHLAYTCYQRKKRAPKNGGRWLVRIIGAFLLKKTGADPGPQSSIAPPVAFFSRDDPDCAIPYFLI